MAKVVLVTGASGFLGSELLRNLNQDKRVVLVRTSSQLAAASEVKVLTGDLEKPGLGLSAADKAYLQGKKLTIFHCAALYDTTATWEDVYKTNVVGTKNLIQFLTRMSEIEQFNFISSIYAAGGYEGIIEEKPLPDITNFHNAYEKSKYEAEKLVLTSGVPATIFRAPILVGRSTTGETAKFDGAYNLIGLIRKGRLIFFPGSCLGPLYLAPVDVVAKFIALAGKDQSNVGKIFNMVESVPVTYSEFIKRTSVLLKKAGPYFVYPQFLWKWTVEILERISRKNLSTWKIFSQRIKITNLNYMKTLKFQKSTHPVIDHYLQKIVKYYVTRV